MQKSDVQDCTIFLTLAGSHAYGTNTPTSDIDLRGVCIPKDRGYYMGFIKVFEQFEDKVNDTVIYDLRKALKLIADCNPNMVDLLFAHEDSWQKTTPYWERVRHHRHQFLSKKARFTYTGYAFAQLKRIKTHRNYLLNPPKKKPERKDFGLPDRELVTADSVGAFQCVLANLLEGSVDYMNLSDATKEELERQNFIGLVQKYNLAELNPEDLKKATGASDEWMNALQREHAYTRALRDWQSYVNWQTQRNKKRSDLEEKFGYDTKHAMHLVRLMRMGKEIMGEGKVQVYRPDAEELLQIRNGAWSYEQLEEYALKMEQEIISLYSTSKLPREPNRNLLDSLCVSVVEEYLSDHC